mmetsp:Transcript_25606/g.76290  ORF Transcript_25606/g.76290 Transcript_25606/m.76290 type:complete len:465 (+) Transcript_25606:1226-2620(+)
MRRGHGGNPGGAQKQGLAVNVGLNRGASDRHRRRCEAGHRRASRLVARRAGQARHQVQRVQYDPQNYPGLRHHLHRRQGGGAPDPRLHLRHLHRRDRVARRAPGDREAVRPRDADAQVELDAVQHGPVVGQQVRPLRKGGQRDPHDGGRQHALRHWPVALQVADRPRCDSVRDRARRLRVPRADRGSVRCRPRPHHRAARARLGGGHAGAHRLLLHRVLDRALGAASAARARREQLAHHRGGHQAAARPVPAPRADPRRAQPRDGLGAARGAAGREELDPHLRRAGAAHHAARDGAQLPLLHGDDARLEEYPGRGAHGRGGAARRDHGDRDGQDPFHRPTSAAGRCHPRGRLAREDVRRRPRQHPLPRGLGELLAQLGHGRAQAVHGGRRRANHRGDRLGRDDRFAQASGGIWTRGPLRHFRGCQRSAAHPQASVPGVPAAGHCGADALDSGSTAGAAVLRRLH